MLTNAVVPICLFFLFILKYIECDCPTIETVENLITVYHQNETDLTLKHYCYRPQIEGFDSPKSILKHTTYECINDVWIRADDKNEAPCENYICEKIKVAGSYSGIYSYEATSVDCPQPHYKSPNVYLFKYLTLNKWRLSTTCATSGSGHNGPADQFPFTTATNTWSNSKVQCIKWTDCYMTSKGEDYVGKTKLGICTPWPSSQPNLPDIHPSHAENFCRNPGSSNDEPFCYDGAVKQLCNMKNCGFCEAPLLNGDREIRLSKKSFLRHGETVDYTCEDWFRTWEGKLEREKTFKCLNGVLENFDSSDCTESSIFGQDDILMRYFFDFTHSFHINGGSYTSNYGQTKTVHVDTTNFNVLSKEDIHQHWNSISITQQVATQACALRFDEASPITTNITIDIWFQAEKVNPGSYINLFKQSNLLSIAIAAFSSASLQLFVSIQGRLVWNKSIDKDILYNLVITIQNGQENIYLNSNSENERSNSILTLSGPAEAVCCGNTGSSGSSSNCVENIVHILGLKTIQKHFSHSEVKDMYQTTNGRKFYFSLSNVAIDCKDAPYSGDYSIEYKASFNLHGMCDASHELHRNYISVERNGNAECNSGICTIEYKYGKGGNTPYEQVKDVVNASPYCYQEVKISCTSSYMVSKSISWVYESNNVEKTSTDWAYDTDSMCKNEDPRMPCKCDNMGSPTMDYGNIVNKEKLPIKAIKYAPPTNDLSLEISIGPLVCVSYGYFTGGLINPCSTNPCGDHGNCYLKTTSTYGCHCHPGYPVELDEHCKIPKVCTNLTATGDLTVTYDPPGQLPVYGSKALINCTNTVFLESSLSSQESYCYSSGSWSGENTLSCYLNCPENFVLYNETCYWPSQSVNLVGTRDEAKYICEQLDSTLAKLEDVNLATLIRTHYEFGSTSALIGLFRKSGAIVWSDESPLTEHSLWAASANDLTENKCVHASLCNSSNPLKYHVVGCESVAPFLCQATKCPEFSTFNNFNLSLLAKKNYHVGDTEILTCNNEYSLNGASIVQPLLCGSDGSWNLSSAECTLHNCAVTPPAVANAKIVSIFGTHTLGAIKEYICKPGYENGFPENHRFVLTCTLNDWAWFNNTAATCNRYAQKYIDIDGPDGKHKPLSVNCHFGSPILTRLQFNFQTQENTTFDLGYSFELIEQFKSLFYVCTQDVDIECASKHHISNIMVATPESAFFSISDEVTNRICDYPGPNYRPCQCMFDDEDSGYIIGKSRVPIYKVYWPNGYEFELNFGALKCYSNKHNYCQQDTCHNGGTCFPQNISPHYECICAPGYSGNNCENKINCGNLTTVHDGIWVYQTLTEYSHLATLACKENFYISTQPETEIMWAPKNITNVACLKTGSWSTQSYKCQHYCPLPFRPTTKTHRCFYHSSFDGVANAKASYVHAKNHCESNHGLLISKEAIEDGTSEFLREYSKDVEPSGKIFIGARKRDNEFFFEGRNDTVESIQNVLNSNVGECVIYLRPAAKIFESQDCSTPTTFACEYFECSTPPSNYTYSTFVEKSGFAYLDKATYSCQLGYEVLDNDLRYKNLTYICGSERIWIPTGASDCSLVDCKEPAIVKYSTKHVEGTKYQQTVNYTCAEHFEMIGNDRIHCQDNGSWTESPICNRVTCPDPGEPTNTTRITNDFLVDTNITYTCTTGNVHVGGDIVRKCTENGTYTGQEPVCEYASCGNFPLIANGQVNLTISLHTFYQAVATYYCNRYFSLVNSSTTTCLANGSWSTLPSCKRVECPEPPPVINSTRLPVTQIFPLNITITYSCVLGYYWFSGNLSRTCLDNGTWTGEAPTCPIVDCKSPPTINNGGRNFTMTKYEDRADYFCDQYFVIAKHNFSTCQANFTWSEKPHCVRTHCPPLPDVNLTTRIDYGTKIGENTTFDCVTGYNLTGGTFVRTCLDTGLWTGAPPVCLRLNCGFPEKVDNATINWHNFLYNDTIRWDCDEGYQRKSGDHEHTCLASALWSGETLVCERISCGDPGTTGNGTRRYTNFLYQGVVNYECHPGFTNVTGFLSLECESNKTWSHPSAVCDRDTCSDPPTIYNSTRKGSFYYNDTIVYECDTGYELTSGNLSLQCILVNDSLIWNAPWPVCKKVSCGPASQVDHASYKETSFSYLDYVNYTCYPGYYKTKGVFIIQCLEDRKWNGTLPVCEKITCGDPGDISNGEKSGQFLFEDVVTYVCDNGYEKISGNLQIKCDADKVWRDEKPVCERVNCTVPEVIPFAVIEGDSYRFGDSLKYICQDGFSTDDGKVVTRICQANREWTGTLPICKRLACGKPENPTNAIAYGEEYVFQSKIFYKCFEGHEQSEGDKEIICQADTSWSGSPISCEPIECPEPPIVFNAQVFGQNGFGQEKTYSCNFGYILKSGDLTRKCQGDKSWSGASPVCELPPATTPKPTDKFDPNPKPTDPPVKQEDVICQGLAVVPNANKYGPEGYVSKGLYVTFVCHEGYEFIEDSTLQSIKVSCLGDRWSRGVPQCKAIVCPSPSVIPHAIISKPEVFLIGSTVEYTCPIGMEYEDRGISRTITCLATKKWSYDAKLWRCRDILCKFKILEGLEYVDRVIKYPGEYFMKCPKGQLHTDGREGVWSFCKLSGAMHPRSPSCGINRCGPPPEVKNAIVKQLVSESYSLIECEPGMRFPDGQVRKILNCTKSLAWVPSTLRPCSQTNCKPPPFVINATDNRPSVFPMKTVIKYSCFKQHSFPDGSLKLSITCNENSEWSNKDPPACKQTFCSSADFSSTLKVNSSSVSHIAETKLKIQCNNDSRLPDGTQQTIITCLEIGKWSSEVGNCLTNRCPSAPYPANSIRKGNTTDLDSVWEYTCKEGHKFANSNARKWGIKCNPGSQWNNTVPDCVEIVCGTPYKLPHAEAIYSTINMNSIVKYKCLKGYQFKLGAQTPKSEIQTQIKGICQENGQWAISIFFRQIGCVLITCPAVIVVDNAVPSNLSTSYGNTIVYTCRTGYQLDSEKGNSAISSRVANATKNDTSLPASTSMFCNENGEWIGVLPSCKISHCLNVIVSTNIKANTTKTSSWTYANFSCPQNYKTTIVEDGKTVTKDWFVSYCKPSGNTVSWEPSPKECSDSSDNTPTEAADANTYGSVAIAMMSVTFGGIVLVDILTIKRDILLLAQNLTKAFGQGPWSKFLAQNAKQVPRVSTSQLRNILFPNQPPQGPPVGQNYSQLSNRFLELRS
ncbi:DgyrCDS13521 [Dimorphilus gyrociliatus]|uniref:DgyrCDS13521 n=1 Tax=Dimorphilus gyrociliatus TaxID=2664684 RepID=A0A7I8WAV4_9ANNE|nr:DgyrCDS13521 [Dimorphilus gyrociliatus]